uniref:Uncharacterized protein n=1 Tax=Rhizophora mucronata TaxID=61149 RepID=A0A2P2P2B6_RHIMU
MQHAIILIGQNKVYEPTFPLPPF